MGSRTTEYWLTDDPNDHDRDPEGNETPETPPDRPRPPSVQDPPPQPDPKGPYLVGTL
jgi:hypothetical protein